MGIGGAIGGGAVIAITIKAIDKYSKELKKFEKNTKKSATKMQKLGILLKKTGIGYGVAATAALAFGISAVKSALQSELAFQQFNLKLGETADIMLYDLRKASKGLVSDFNLVDNANRALALGIDKNQLPQLMETAAARAKVFGRTVTDAFQDITIGIGRQSRLILDNLGIILDLDKVYGEYAESVGKATEALSESEKKFALTNAILEETKPLLKAQIFLIETQTEKLQRLSAAYDNVIDSIGLWLVDVGSAITFSSDLEKEFAKNVDTALQLEGAFIDTGNAILTLGDELRSAEDRAKGLLNSLRDVQGIMLAGESEKGLEIAKKQAQINSKKLDIARLSRFEDEAIRTGLKQEKRDLEALEEELEILRLEKQVGFQDFKDVEQAKADAFIAEQSGMSQTVDKFLETQETKKSAYGEEKINIKTLTDKQNEFIKTIDRSGIVSDEVMKKLKDPAYKAEEDAIQSVIDKTNSLISAYKRAGAAKATAGIGGGGALGARLRAAGGTIASIFGSAKSALSVGDAIIRPNGDVIETHPQDTLIATKNPGGMGATIIIEGNNIYGTDPDDIANALQEKLSDKIKY